MGGGTSASAGAYQETNVKHDAKVGQNASVNQTDNVSFSVKMAIKASTFARVDCSTQAQTFQKLIACGRLVVEDKVSDEYDVIAEAAADEYDSEVDFGDDDEIRDEDDSFEAYASPNNEDAPQLDFSQRFHEIKIVETAPGEWSCIPPRDPLLGYRSYDFDAEAQKIIEAVRKQFVFYEKVAKWLRNEGNEVLKSIADFKARHVLVTQKDFCRRFDLFKGKEGKVDTSNIHAYCQNCRLSWDNASLPLDCVFGGAK